MRYEKEISAIAVVCCVAYAKTEPSVTSLSAADSVLSEKTAPTAAAASYPLISPYTLGKSSGGLSILLETRTIRVFLHTM